MHYVLWLQEGSAEKRVEMLQDRLATAMQELGAVLEAGSQAAAAHEAAMGEANQQIARLKVHLNPSRSWTYQLHQQLHQP